MKLVDSKKGPTVQISWEGLDESEKMLEPLKIIYEDVPQLLLKLIERKKTPSSLATEESCVLLLLRRGLYQNNLLIIKMRSALSESNLDTYLKCRKRW